MLQDSRVEQMADVLVNYSLGVQPGWQVGIQSSTLAAPLIAAVYRKVLAAGGHPVTDISLPGLSELLLKLGDDAQLGAVSPFARVLWEEFDALLFIHAEETTRPHGAVPPERLALWTAARRRTNRGFAWREQGKPYCITAFPTPAAAQDADMSLSEYEDFVFRACMLDAPDPIAAWRGVRDSQQRLVDWLQGKREVHVESADIDLTLGIAGRTFLNSDGKYNFPSGEIFTGPQEDSVRGRIHFTYPAHYGGRDVEDVTLVFEAGRVAHFTAGRGADYLARVLDTDAGARRLGEFAIGTNPGVDRFTRNVLFDEKMAGTIHCALGQSYAQTGGANTSAIHWDMVADMHAGRITVDGALFYEDGAFRV